MVLHFIIFFKDLLTCLFLPVVDLRCYTQTFLYLPRGRFSLQCVGLSCGFSSCGPQALGTQAQ